MNQRKLFATALIFAGILLLTNAVWGSAGDQLWETKFTFRPNYNGSMINAMAVSQTTLIVCGIAYNGLPQLAPKIGFIKAFNITTGFIEWEKEFFIANGGMAFNNFTAINLLGDIAVVSGYSRGDILGHPEMGTIQKSIVIAYNAATGQLLWEAQTDSYLRLPETDFTAVSLPITTAANNRAFLSVKEKDTAGMDSGNLIVRAFQVKDVTTPPLSLLLD